MFGVDLFSTVECCEVGWGTIPQHLYFIGGIKMKDPEECFTIYSNNKLIHKPFYRTAGHAKCAIKLRELDTTKNNVSIVKYIPERIVEKVGAKRFINWRSPSEVDKLTMEQEIAICELIGSWYLSWKNKMTDGSCHKLGFAKEELKSLISQKMGFSGWVADNI